MPMQIGEIVKFWREQQESDEDGQWMHALDREVLKNGFHTFNLDFPVSPFVGDVESAPVIILGANAGYNEEFTPTEFSDAQTMTDYVNRVNNPSGANWTAVSRYYDNTNYGRLIAGGRAVLVNACAYRSPKLSEERDNLSIMNRLPSVKFTRRWLSETLLPMAANGERLIIGKRYGQWKLPPTFRHAEGVVIDPAPISPQITRKPYVRMMQFLNER